MGSTYASGLVDAVENGWASLEQALLVHLRSNHYPPIPAVMVKPARLALALAVEEKWDAEIDLRETGVLFRNRPVAPVYALFESMHLGDFLPLAEELVYSDVELLEDGEPQ